MATPALTLSRGQWDEMVAHVAAHAPEEACGLVGGAGGRALRVVPIENALHSPVAYTMEPYAQIETMMEFERAGWELLAIFHSHPAGPAGPSTTDVRQAYYPESLYVILSPGPKGGWQAHAFRIDEGQVEEAELIVAGAEAGHRGEE